MHAQSQKSKTLVLFDFDGTLYPHDSFTRFIFFSLNKTHIVRRGIPVLPWIIAYFLKAYPAHLMRPRLFKAMFRGCSNQEIEAKAKLFSQKLLIDLNPVLLNQLKQHQTLGHDVVLVSATVDLYLKYVSEALNITLICTHIEIKDGQITGNYTTADCSNEQKKLRVLEQFNLDDYSTTYAYGNSTEDEAMLSLTNHPYMVGSSQSLALLAP